MKTKWWYSAGKISDCLSSDHLSVAILPQDEQNQNLSRFVGKESYEPMSKKDIDINDNPREEYDKLIFS